VFFGLETAKIGKNFDEECLFIQTYSSSIEVLAETTNKLGNRVLILSLDPTCTETMRLGVNPIKRLNPKKLLQYFCSGLFIFVCYNVVLSTEEHKTRI
jgi:hypothetical protein